MQHKLLRVSLLTSLFGVLILGSTALAAAQTPKNPTPAPAATPRPARPADEESLQKAAAIKDPQTRTEALIKSVSDYPHAPFIRNVIFYLMRPLRPTYPEPEKVRPLIDRFVAGTSNAPSYARNEFYYNIARELLNYGILPDIAEDLARRSVPLLDQTAYLANERAIYDQRESFYRARDPQYKSEPFSVAQATEKFRSFRALNYATLGRALVKRGKLDEAEKTLKQAQQIAPSMEAATALADIMEQRGRDTEALDYLGTAALTGRLNAAGIERLHALYRKLHQGKLEGLEESLDARYRKAFRSPIKAERHRPKRATRTASERTVLAEFITGAACEPCISVDLSFDAALERYSRDELVLLVYHIHAPTSDPLSNASAQARSRFYDAHGAPTTYIDGQNEKPGEGLSTEAEGVFRNLDATIASQLTVPPEARIKLTAQFEGKRLKVSAGVDGIKMASPDLRLQIALVETEVSYSGENGLRFHPMVVRNLARKSGSDSYGFSLSGSDSGGADYLFDLEEISAPNLKYYDEYIAEMKKRLGESFEVSFKEKRYLIDRARLSVVAFVQDEKSKKILQSAYLKVAPAASASGR